MRINNLTTNFKVTEFIKLGDIQNKDVREKDVLKLKAVVESDIDKLKNILKFIFYLNWTEPILESIKTLTNGLIQKQKDMN